MTEIIIAVAAKVSEYLVAPIGRQLSYLFCYRSYTDELHNKRDEIKPIVQEWLNRVDEITGEAEELKKDENKSCFNGWCPNLKSRYLLSREADKKAQVIVEVQENRNFPDGVSYRVPPRNVTFKEYESFESRASTVNKVMDALRDDEINKIGVWGMGGVGKTTLVKQVAQLAEDEKLFTTLVYIDVSWTRDSEKLQEGIAKIQQKIADMLGLQFKGKDESTRAVELMQRLQREKILIILDDIWKEVSLEEVGIPSKDDQKGCKIVLASRNEDLLRKDMGAKECFPLQHLPKEEAWHLFKKTAGDSVEGDKLRPIAIEWSYNHLKGDEVKSLFLLCGWLSYGYISMHQLLQYAMGLDLFDHLKSLEQARNKLVALVRTLKASSLLLDGEDHRYDFGGEASRLLFMDADNKSVRMHDVVRDVARNIASKDPHPFVVRQDVPLEEWPETDESKYISLSCNDVHELPHRLKLQVLSMVGSDIRRLPSEMGQLTNLRLLDLNCCRHLVVIPRNILSSLSRLECLCMKSSFTRWAAEGLEQVDRSLLLRDGIGKLLKKTEELELINLKVYRDPIPIRSLDNLKILDVEECHGLKFLFLLSTARGLSQLEEMTIKSCKAMQQLIGCEGEFEIKEHLLELMNFDYFGSNLETTSQETCSQGNPNIHMPFSVSFPHNLEELVLQNLPKLIEMDVGIFAKLKILTLEVSFHPNLEELVLTNIPKLIEMDVGNLPNLRILRLEELHGCLLSKVSFPPNLEELVLKSLPKLIEMDVGNLPNLRILNLKEQHGCLLSKVSFPPNLEELVLKSLPKLIEMDVGNLPNLRILRLEELHGCLLSKVSFPPNLEELVLKSLPKLIEMDVGNLPNLRILELEELHGCLLSKEELVLKSLPKLIEMDVGNLPNLRILNLKEQHGCLLSKASFLESRASTLNDIMDALRDDNINLIGVWGMAGVGKTTLLKQVAQQAKQQRFFTRQAYMDVSSISGLETLRQKIVEELGLLWEPNADELKQRLKEGKILIILDDIWTEIDLEKVGIPCKGDETQCKIVLASRDDLLCKDMGAQRCFPVKRLPPDEAWSFFKKTAGDSVEENPELQVVEECEGLPIAIVTIAKALKDETVAVWENALEQLRSCAPTNIRAVDKKVYSCLEWSYTHLKGDDVKSLFLLCGMLGYGDISLDLLLRYGMGLDLFDRIDSLERARNRLLALVDFLKASGLLLDSHEDRNKFDEERASSSLFMDADNKFVRMHSIVREVARAIASKDPHPFVVREDVGLEEWSETDESKRCAFISLHCKAVHDLPQELVWPELQFFLLQNNNPLLNIPNTFFEGMKKLKVLDLSRMHFTTLPSSLDSLANLRTLRLDGCELGDIALIGKLTKLEVLSLMGSTIQQLPNEMSRLTNLRLLDLNDCEKLEVIPRNILSSLSQLECLYMKSNILFENLTRYAIYVGYWWASRTKKALKLQKFNRSLHLGDGMSKLLERSEELEFSELSGTKYVLHPSDRESFLELKHLKVACSPEIQYIMDSKNQQLLQHGAFRLLESLFLGVLENLEKVWHGPIPIGSFAHLIHNFQNLKKIDVQDCELLEHVIILQEIDGNVEILSKLETLKLKNLPRLRWIEDGNDRMKHISSLMTLMNIQNLQELHIIDCSMEDLRKM
ncbi:hypothetical protein AAG906_013043 [Vitis piasezkii]